METSRQQRILRWLTLFLFVINVSAFTTLLFLNKQNNVFTNNTTTGVDDYLKSDEFFQKQLDLNPEQYKQVSNLDNNVMRAYQLILDLQCEVNFEILDELSSPNPSVSKLDSMAQRLGRLNGALKKQTIKHFLNIRSLCTPEQQVKLRKLLTELLEVEKDCRYCNKKECSRRDRILKK